MDSSLSSVPPVWPSPRPLTMGTTTPHAAASGASIRDTLSPTPPVLCLSTVRPSADRSKVSPERIISSARAAVSAKSIPLRNIAISSADAW